MGFFFFFFKAVILISYLVSSGRNGVMRANSRVKEWSQLGSEVEEASCFVGFMQRISFYLGNRRNPKNADDLARRTLGFSMNCTMPAMIKVHTFGGKG